MQFHVCCLKKPCYGAGPQTTELSGSFVLFFLFVDRSLMYILSVNCASFILNSSFSYSSTLICDWYQCKIIF